MKQFCRVYLAAGTQDIVAVFTGDTDQPPAFEPVTSPDLDAVDLDVDFGEDQPYVRPEAMRQALEMRNDAVRAKAGSVAAQATITEKRGRRPQEGLAVSRALQAPPVAKKTATL